MTLPEQLEHAWLTSMKAYAEMQQELEAWKAAFNALWWRSVGQPFIDRLSGHDALAATHARVGDKASRDGWQPIETAPRDGQQRLVGHFVGVKLAWQHLATFDSLEGSRHWYKMKGGGCFPTHWFPVPLTHPETAANAEGGE